MLVNVGCVDVSSDEKEEVSLRSTEREERVRWVSTAQPPCFHSPAVSRLSPRVWEQLQSEDELTGPGEQNTAAPGRGTTTRLPPNFYPTAKQKYTKQRCVFLLSNVVCVRV